METDIQSISTGIVILAFGIGFLVVGMYMIMSKQKVINAKLGKILKHLGIEEEK